MTARVFVDSNVFIYAFDASEPEKKAMAIARLRACRDLGPLVLSTQVLQEFFVTVTRKLPTPLPPAEARAAVADLANHDVVLIDPPMILAAATLSEEEHLAFWDALIVQAALAAGCSNLLSEDLQDGRRYRGLQVENPFRP